MSDYGHDRLCSSCGSYHTAGDICPSDYDEDDREIAAEIKAEMDKERREAETEGEND